MLRAIVFSLTFLLINNMAFASQFNFQFKKGLLSSKYSLIVSNNDTQRTVEFYGCYNEAQAETGYYVVMKNGLKHYFDSKKFCGIGMKGRYWINAGQRGQIPFDIEKSIMKNAEKVVLKGHTYIPVERDGVIWPDDMRELMISFDVNSETVSYEIGAEVINLNEKKKEKGLFDIPSDSTEFDDLKGILNNEKEIKKYRLRSE